MKIYMYLYCIVLFILLTPGIIITLPSRESNKYIATIVHAVAFTLVYNLAYNMADAYFYPVLAVAA